MPQALADACVVRQNIMVPMRDGVRLASDIYLPADQDKPLAVILERTPYDKQGVSRSERSFEDPEPLSRPAVARWFAQRGFVVVMQDCRGRYGSEGKFIKYLAEANDGVDTLAWIRQQDWCDGRVATMGLSYGAHTQLAMACLAPEGLACMFLDSGGFSSAWHSGIRRGGAFELKQATWAYRHALLSPETAADPVRKADLEKADLAGWFKEAAWWPGHSPLSAAPEFENYLFDQWRNSRFGPYWKQLGLYAESRYQQIPDVPIAIVGSWYDPYASASLVNFLGIRKHHRRPTCLLMGPWTHGNRSQSHAGEVDFGAAAALDNGLQTSYLEYRLAWFRRWLADDNTTATADIGAPREGVTWFEMGGGNGRKNPDGRLQHGGSWRYSLNWPPDGLEELQLYLHPEGSLKNTSPEAESTFLEYRYDPANPIPTLGGAVTSGEPLMFGGAFDQDQICLPLVHTTTSTHTVSEEAQLSGILTFETEPLKNDLVLTGKCTANLWFGSDCPDTDLTIKLIDVHPPNEDYPDGYAMNIADGILRQRHRESPETESWMKPGEIYAVWVETLHSCNRFKAGHRLRIDISSSNYPQFDINPNNGKSMAYPDAHRIAHNRIYFGKHYPSSVQLPVMKNDEDK